MGFDKFYCPVCGQPHANRGVCWSCQSRERYETQRQLVEQRRTADQIAYAAEAQMEHDRAVALITAAHQEQLAREVDRDRKKEAERTFVRHTLHEIASQEVDNLTRAAARLGVFLGTQEYRRNVKLTEHIAVELGLGEAYLLAVLTRVEKADSGELREFLDRMIQRSPTTYEIIMGNQAFRSRPDYERLRNHQEDYHARIAQAEDIQRRQREIVEKEKRLKKVARIAVALFTFLVFAVVTWVIARATIPPDAWNDEVIKLTAIGAACAFVPAFVIWKVGLRLAPCWVDHRLGRGWRFPGLFSGETGKEYAMGAAMLIGVVVYFGYTGHGGTDFDMGVTRILGHTPFLFWGGLVLLEAALVGGILWLLWPRD